MHPRFRRFPRVFPKKRLELKSLKRQTKAEEEGTPGPFLLSLRLPLKALLFEPFLRKNSGKTCSRKHHTILKNRMAVLRNRYPPNIPPAGADPLLKYTHMKSHSCSKVREVVAACIRTVIVTMGHPRSCHTCNLWVISTVGHRPTTEWSAICKFTVLRSPL